MLASRVGAAEPASLQRSRGPQPGSHDRQDTKDKTLELRDVHNSSEVVSSASRSAAQGSSARPRGLQLHARASLDTINQPAPTLTKAQSLFRSFKSPEHQLGIRGRRQGKYFFFDMHGNIPR